MNTHNTQMNGPVCLGITIEIEDAHPLAPFSIQTSPEADRVYEQKATATIRKIKQDVTRHRCVSCLLSHSYSTSMTSAAIPYHPPSE